MTQADRTRLRLKQDFLVMLCEMANQDQSLRIDEKQSAPTIAALRAAIYPEWEWNVDGHIARLSDSQVSKVGIPDFNRLAQLG